MDPKALHFAASLAALVSCAPASPQPPRHLESKTEAVSLPSLQDQTPAVETPVKIAVDDDPQYRSCAFQQVSLRQKLFLSASESLVPSMAQIRLVRTSGPAVGGSTSFDVVHTLVGSAAATVEWQHGGTLHPINELIEPDKLFALFELAPREGTSGGSCIVPEGPFIRDIDGPEQLFSGHASSGKLEGIAAASDADVARAILASLPVAGAGEIGIARGHRGARSSVEVGGVKFEFYPPFTTEELKTSRLPEEHATSVSIATAVELEGHAPQIVISGWHSTAIGVAEQRGPGLKLDDAVPRTRRFQVVARKQSDDLFVVSQWFGPPAP